MKFLINDSNKIDLHIHTRYSDGKESPISLVRNAKIKGMEYIAFSDHNVDDARFEFDKKELEKIYKIKIIPGCEIGAIINGKKVHLLAYNYNSFFINAFLPKFRKASANKNYLSVKKVCSLVHLCGGKVFLAHPFKYKYDGKEIVKEILNEKCIDGIECIHSYHTQEEIDYLLEVCECNKLLVSAGSDFHYKGKNIRDDYIQNDIGDLPVSGLTIEEQIIKAKQKYNVDKKR